MAAVVAAPTRKLCILNVSRKTSRLESSLQAIHEATIVFSFGKRCMIRIKKQKTLCRATNSQITHQSSYWAYRGSGKGKEDKCASFAKLIGLENRRLMATCSGTRCLSTDAKDISLKIVAGWVVNSATLKSRTGRTKSCPQHQIIMQ